MQITTWNIRGCNSALKKRLLKRRIDKEKSGIIFLQETKFSGEELANIAHKVWKGCESIAIDATGVARGLGILWNPHVVTLSGFLATNCTISADFHILSTKIRGVISNVYGPPKVVQKQAFIESLIDLKPLVQNRAWIIRGDINLIRNLDEKKGGIRSLNIASTLFNNTISDLDLIDVRNSNGIFTWNNKQSGDRGISCRLDRLLLSESVMMDGGNLRAIVLPVAGSNHWPITLEWDNVRFNPRRPFRFEKFWILQPNFQEKLKNWWENSPPH